jgi:hypothetical protein
MTALLLFAAAVPQNALTQRIVDARKKLKSVQIPYDFRVKISAICSELNVDGIRGDIVTNRAAKALASFEGRDDVAVEDIYRYATCASVACMPSGCLRPIHFCVKRWVALWRQSNSTGKACATHHPRQVNLSWHLSLPSTHCVASHAHIMDAGCCHVLQGHPPVPASPLEEGPNGRH